MDPKDKRRAARLNHDSALEIYDASGHFITGIGRMINFSKVGVCFSSTKQLSIGETLRVRLRLLREGILEVSARVVWIKKKPTVFLYGLVFDAVQKIRP